jgi:hypothetical protein
MGETDLDPNKQSSCITEQSAETTLRPHPFTWQACMMARKIIESYRSARKAKLNLIR